MNKKVNILFVNYNSGEDLIACLATLLKVSYTNFCVYIVDNLSNDNSINVIQDYCKKQQIINQTITKEQWKTYSNNENKIVIIKNNVNNGFGAGLNVVLKKLIKNREDQYVWIVNPDIEIEKNVLTDQLKCINNKKKAIIGNSIYYYHNKNQIMYYGGFEVKKWSHGIKAVTKKQNRSRIDAITGSSLLTRVSTFKDLGLFSETYFMYWEETDFCARARKQNYSFFVNDASKIFDKVASTKNHNFLREYFYLLNGLRYYKKYYPYHLPVILISTFAKQIKALFSFNKVKTKAIWMAHIDFIKLLMGLNINVKKRISSNA